ncbi:MAG: type VI secretion system contractile sheath large subunit [Polyangiaceae bacterium]
MPTLISELASLLREAHPRDPDDPGTEAPKALPVLDDRRAYAALRRALRSVHPMVTTAEVALDCLIDSLDRDVSTVLDAVLHHPAMRSLEAAWRGLRWVVDAVDSRENARCELLNCSKEDLLADFEDSPEVPKSGLYKVIYSSEYGPFGGRAYGALFANYTFGAGPQDVALLHKCAAVANMAALPLLTSFQPQPADARASGPQYTKRSAFFRAGEARFVAGTWQRIAARAPWATTWKSGLRFEETSRTAGDRVWMSGALAAVVLAARSFAKWRLATDLDGPVQALELDSPWSPELDERMVEHGAMALAAGDEGVRIVAPRTCASADSLTPAGIGGAALTPAEAVMHRDLRGVFAITRFVQLAKTVHREQIGTWREREDLERELGELMERFRGRGLEGQEVKVQYVEGNVGWYRFELRVRAGWSSGPALTLVSGDQKLDLE